MPKRARPIIAITVASLLAAPLAANSAEPDLKIAIGMPGSDSFTFGTELWAMSQIALAPVHGIGFESHEVATDGERLGLLLENKVEVALVHGGIPTSYAQNMRAVMALWPNGQFSSEVDPMQLLVHEHVADDVIYRITKAIFKNADMMKSAHATLGIALPREAMTGLDVPLHPGAHRYYEEVGLGFNVEAGLEDSGLVAPTPAPSQRAGSTVAYRDFDDSALNEAEIAQIVAACRQALDVGSLSPVLGDLSSTGCEAYQDQLATARSGAPSSEEQAMFNSPVGKGGPAIVLDGDDPHHRAAVQPDRQRTELPSRQPVM